MKSIHLLILLIFFIRCTAPSNQPNAAAEDDNNQQRRAIEKGNSALIAALQEKDAGTSLSLISQQEYDPNVTYDHGKDIAMTVGEQLIKSFEDQSVNLLLSHSKDPRLTAESRLLFAQNIFNRIITKDRSFSIRFEQGESIVQIDESMEEAIFAMISAISDEAAKGLKHRHTENAFSFYDGSRVHFFYYSSIKTVYTDSIVELAGPIRYENITDAYPENEYLLQVTQLTSEGPKKRLLIYSNPFAEATWDMPPSRSFWDKKLIFSGTYEGNYAFDSGMNFPEDMQIDINKIDR